MESTMLQMKSLAKLMEEGAIGICGVIFKKVGKYE